MHEYKRSSSSMIVDYYKKANLEYDMKNYDNASKYINLAITRQKKPEYYFFRGIVNETINNLDRSYDDFKKAKELDPNNYLYWENLGKICKELRKHDEAIENFVGAINLIGENEEERTLLASLYFELGSVHETEENYDLAKHSYEKAIELDSKDALNYKFKKVNLIESEDFKGKLSKLLDSSVFFDVNSSKIFTEEETNENVRSVKDQHSKLAEEEINNLKDELLKKPYDPILNQKLGRILRDLERHDEAIQYFERSLEKQKRHKTVIIKLADSYLKIKDYQKAIYYCDMLIELDENFFKSYKIKSIAHFELKEYEKALQNIDKVIELRPDNRPSIDFKKKIQYEINLKKFDASIDNKEIFSTKYPEDKIFSDSKVLVEILEEKNEIIEPEIIVGNSKILERGENVSISNYETDVKINVSENLVKQEKPQLEKFEESKKDLYKDNYVDLENPVNVLTNQIESVTQQISQEKFDLNAQVNETLPNVQNKEEIIVEESSKKIEEKIIENKVEQSKLIIEDDARETNEQQQAENKINSTNLTIEEKPSQNNIEKSKSIMKENPDEIKLQVSKSIVDVNKIEELRLIVEQKPAENQIEDLKLIVEEKLSVIKGSYSKSFEEENISDTIIRESFSIAEEKPFEAIVQELSSINKENPVEPIIQESSLTAEEKPVEPIVQEFSSTNEEKPVEPIVQESSSINEEKLVEPMVQESSSTTLDKLVEPIVQELSSNNEEKPVELIIQESSSINEKKPVESMVQELSSINEEKPFEAIVQKSSSSNKEKPFEPIVQESSSTTEDKPEIINSESHSINNTQLKETVNEDKKKIKRTFFLFRPIFFLLFFSSSISVTAYFYRKHPLIQDFYQKVQGYEFYQNLNNLYKKYFKNKQ